MNAILRVLAEDAALRYAANLALGATAASAIGLLIAMMVRSNAALRQGFLTATIVVMTALPLLVLPEWQGGLIRAGSITGRSSDYSAETAPASLPSGEAATTFQQNISGAERVSPLQPPPMGRTRIAGAEKMAILVERLFWGGLLVWGVGSLWCALLTVQSLMALRRVCTRSVDAGATWSLQVQQAAKAVGLAQAPQVVFAAGAVVPFSLGGRQPLIVLPESARKIEAAEAEAILLHEAGHIVHRHHLLGILMTVVGIVYWWLLPVRWTHAALADTMEEVCDNHVLQVQGDGRALGRCLVNAAEAACHGFRALQGSAILHGRRGLSRRLARVLEGTGNKETGMNRLGRAASILVALACLGVCAMVRVAPVGAEEGPAQYFPLTVGSEWTYRATYAGQEKPGEQQWKVRRSLPLQKGGTCIEIETIYGGQRSGYLYTGLRKDGYYAYENAYIGMPGVNEDAPPSPLALFPLKAGQSWTWHEAWRGQIQVREGDPTPDTSTWGSECKATVEKTDDMVTVPAGRYRTLRIRIQRQNRHFGDSEEIAWYAKGVGMVRREDRSIGQNASTSVVELTRFLPGTRQEEVSEDMLPLVRKMLAGQAPPHTLRTISLRNAKFPDHFAVAIWEPEKHVIYRMAGTKVVVFNPLDFKEWNRLLKEEGATKPLFGPAGDPALAQEIGVLMAEGMWTETDAKTHVEDIKTKKTPDGGMEMQFVVKGFPKMPSLWLIIWVEANSQGEITALKRAPLDTANAGGPPARERPLR